MATHTSIIKEPDIAKRDVQKGARGIIVGDIMGDITPWRKHRDGEFEVLWDEFYAKWRGFWNPAHKSFKTERSRIIGPLTSMAIDLTTAEIIEAVLGREYFIDLPDNVGDADHADVDAARKLLVEDLRKGGFIDQFSFTVLNGCIYGTGITKIHITTKVVKSVSRDSNKKLVVTSKQVAVVNPVAIEPGNFVPDPSTRDIDDMKGCAHEFMMPLSMLRRRQGEGAYYKDVNVGTWHVRAMNPNRGDTPTGNQRMTNSDAAFITEYYGLVPTRHFQAAQAEAEGAVIPDSILNAIPEHDMIEVIATIANEGTLLRLIENPLVTGERLIVAYQHEAVPGRFWGRGVAEKAANVQRAMDAEMRARIDQLAWSNNPMFAGDLTRLPPGGNMNAWPGKMWGTRGDPNKILKEFKLTGPDQNSYAHIQDLERMGQQATGAMDSQGLRGGVRDETATGSALAASSFIKRSKRTMYNVEGYMNKLVRRTLRLKMIFEPDRYPQDYDFQVRGSIGIMAREIETQFMVNLMSVIGPESPASMPIIKAIFEHSGSPVRSEVVEALKALEDKKPTPEEEAAKAAALAMPVAELEKVKAETAKLMGAAEKLDAEEEMIEAETDLIPETSDLKKAKLIIELDENEIQDRALDIQEDKNVLTSRGLDIQQQIANQKKTVK